MGNTTSAVGKPIENSDGSPQRPKGSDDKNAAWATKPIGCKVDEYHNPLRSSHPSASNHSISDSHSVASAEADFTVFLDSEGRAVAKSSISGQVIHYSIHTHDCWPALQAAVDALPQTGGKVYIAAGCYSLSRTLSIKDKHGVHLCGACRGQQGPDKGGSVLMSTKAITLLEVNGEVMRVFGVTISNLLLWGPSKEGDSKGLWVHGTADTLTLYNLCVNNVGIGMHLQGLGGADTGVTDASQISMCDPQRNGTGMLLESCCYTKIVGGEMSDCDEYGICIRCPEDEDHRCSGVKIIGVTAVRNGKHALLVGRSTHCLTVTGGCDWGGSGTGSGILITNGGSGPPPSDIIISGNHCYNNAVDGITIETGSNIVVQGNICSCHPHMAVPTTPQQLRGIRIGPAVKGALVYGNITHGNAQQGVLNLSDASAVYGNMEQEDVIQVGP